MAGQKRLLPSRELNGKSGMRQYMCEDRRVSDVAYLMATRRGEFVS